MMIENQEFVKLGWPRTLVSSEKVRGGKKFAGKLKGL